MLFNNFTGPIALGNKKLCRRFAILGWPMRDDVTLQCCLSLAQYILKMIPGHFFQKTLDRPLFTIQDDIWVEVSFVGSKYDPRITINNLVQFSTHYCHVLAWSVLHNYPRHPCGIPTSPRWYNHLKLLSRDYILVIVVRYTFVSMYLADDLALEWKLGFVDVVIFFQTN